MKRCPRCGREYDTSMMFCLDDGAELLYGPASTDEPATAILSEPGAVATGFPDGEQTVHFPRGPEAEPPETFGSSSERQSLSAHRAAQPQEGDSAHRAAQPQEGDSAHRAAQPKEHRAAEPQERRAESGSSGRHKLLGVIAGVALLLGGGIFAYRYLATTSKQIESIAVMPFVNESGNAEVEYLSDGMTETLISSLTKVPNLNVKSRSSVFRYKGKETDAKTVGEELNVQAILNGRVAQRGDQLTLSLELVDVATDNAIWSQQYTRRQTDLVSLQSEIARDVSGKLKSQLSGTDAAKVEKTYTANPEAYQLYLKGRYQWNKRTGESLKQAVEFFDQAIAKDPNYALAYSGLAESYVLFPNYSVAMPMDCMPKAKAAALRAIELDDSLAETYTALGIYYSNFAWNQPAAEKEFRRAIELNPNYAPAHQQFGIECLTAMGRFDEAIAEGKRAVELDPVSTIINADLGNALTRARRFDEAIEQLNRTLSLDQNFFVTYWYLGQTYHANGQYAEAVAAYRKGLALNDNPFLKALLIHSLVETGERGEAVKLFDELKTASARRYVSGSSLAIASASLGERDKAFAYLDKELADRAARPAFFSVNPIWDDLRDDPRFAALIRKVEQSKLD